MARYPSKRYRADTYSRKSKTSRRSHRGVEASSTPLIRAYRKRGIFHKVLIRRFLKKSRRFKFKGKNTPLKEAASYVIIVLLLTVLITLLYNLATGKYPRIDIRNVSEMKIHFTTVDNLRSLSIRFGIGFDELLAVYMTDNLFFPERSSVTDENTLERLYIVNYANLKEKHGEERIRPYQNLFRTLLNEIKRFPVSLPGITYTNTELIEGVAENSNAHGYMFGDGFSNSFGKKTHLGTDIYDRENIKGRLNIISMTDGVIQNVGYNKTNGNYIIIITDAGNRYYYYHLESFSEETAKGARVYAGQVIGTMGDSGSACKAGGIYVRLHIGIKVKSDLKQELWINPYIFLRLVEKMVPRANITPMTP